MKFCVKCGGSALRDYRPYCEHTEDENPPPEPTTRKIYLAEKREEVWRATLRFESADVEVDHPLKETAIELVKKEWKDFRRRVLARREELIEKDKREEALRRNEAAEKAEPAVGQTWKHRVSGRTVELLRLRQLDNGRAVWDAKNKFDLGTIAAEALIANYELVPQATKPVLVVGQRWRHTKDGYIVELLSLRTVGDHIGEWRVKSDARMGIGLIHPDHIVRDFELVSERSYEEWLALAESAEVIDRKQLANGMIALGYSPREYMPMDGKTRARILADAKLPAPKRYTR